MGTSASCLSAMLALALLAACDAPRSDVAPARSEGGSAPTRADAAAAEAPAATTPPQAPVPPAAAASRYTSLAEKDCRQVKAPDAETGMGGESECAGVDGWRLRAVEGDARMSLDVVTPAGKVFPLKFPSVVSSGFSGLGDTAEWRAGMQGSAPQALIVRLNVNEDPERPERVTSYLVVSKLGGDAACVVAKIAPGAGQNEAARKAADSASQAACLQAPG